MVTVLRYHILVCQRPGRDLGSVLVLFVILCSGGGWSQCTLSVGYFWYLNLGDISSWYYLCWRLCVRISVVVTVSLSFGIQVRKTRSSSSFLTQLQWWCLFIGWIFSVELILGP